MLLWTLRTNIEALLGSMMAIFFSTRNNQMNTPISKYFFSFCCVSLVFVVIIFVFVLFGIVL
jgi:hypothetical protein